MTVNQRFSLAGPRGPRNSTENSAQPSNCHRAANRWVSWAANYVTRGSVLARWHGTWGLVPWKCWTAERLLWMGWVLTSRVLRSLEVWRSLKSIRRNPVEALRETKEWSNDGDVPSNDVPCRYTECSNINTYVIAHLCICMWLYVHIYLCPYSCKMSRLWTCA